MLYDINSKNNKCIIITAYGAQNIRSFLDILPDDYVICADAGYKFALAQKIKPNVLIGDFDSYPEEIHTDAEMIKYPPEKDDTDTLICLKHGMEKGYDEFVIVGGLGGRLDHTISNIQTAAYGYEHNKFVMLADEKNFATLIAAETVRVPKMEGYKLSLLAYSDQCEGVSIRGAQYPLTNATLKNSEPIGVSNEFAADEIEIENHSGKLLIVLSRD